MAGERRPLGVDIWNRPWPPKHMEGDSFPPVRRVPPPVPPPEIPLPPATHENWLAVMLAVMAGTVMLGHSFMGRWGWTSLPFVAYFGLIAWAVYRVRLHPERRGLAFFWFSTILLQLAIALLAAGELFAAELSDRPLDRRGELFVQIAAVCFLLGWIPTLGLLAHSLRATALLLVQALSPVCLLLFAGILGLD